MPGILLKELKKLGEKAGLYIALQPADGGRIHDAHEYTLAFPEGVALRSKEIPGLNPLIFHRLRDSHVLIWESLETHFREIGTLKASQPGEPQMGRNFRVSTTPE